VCWPCASALTRLPQEHPVGAKSILAVAGKDTPREFTALHKPAILAKYAHAFCIGTGGRSRLCNRLLVRRINHDDNYNLTNLTGFLPVRLRLCAS
jgi:hypothetical protein